MSRPPSPDEAAPIIPSSADSSFAPKPSLTEPPLSHASDEELAKAAAAVGDPREDRLRAFETLLARYERRTLAFLAAHCLKGELDDVQQELWLKVWENLAKNYRNEHFRGWLFQIARHLTIDKARRRGKLKTTTLDETHDVPESSPSPETALIAEERKRALEQCIGKLKPDEAMVVRCRMSEDSSTTADRLGLPVERVYRLYHDACVKLKACLERALGSS